LLGHGGDLDRVEVTKDFTEGGPMRFDCRPAQTGLEYRLDELFNVAAIILGAELEVTAYAPALASLHRRGARATLESLA
jgi:hypothetical protein